MTAADPVILTYHSLDQSGSVISVAPETFGEHMRLLANSGRPVVNMEQIMTTPGGVAITFDDGYLNFQQHAVEILLQYRLPATVFVVTGQCGQVVPWSGPERLMDWDELAAIRDCGVAIGGHSVTHPNLTSLPDSSARVEIESCHQAILMKLGVTASTFAYPYGASNPKVRELVKASFPIACGTRLDSLQPDSDPCDLPRIDMYYFRDPKRLGDLLTGKAAAYLTVRKSLRTIRQRVLG